MAAINRPLLLIETPRAGVFGHRFLVGDPDRLVETSPAEIFSRASLATHGPDYIAVKKQVEQELPGGSIRTGPETLVVAKIKCDRIRSEEKAVIEKWLNDRMGKITGLITTLPDNRTAGSRTVLAVPELAAWEEDLLRLVPPAALKRPSRILPSLTGFILGIAAAIAGVWFMWK